MTPAQAVKWRKETKRTQEVVAWALDITRGCYALWEQGRSTLGKQRLAALTALVAGKQTSTLRHGSAGVKRVEPKLVLVYEASIESVIPAMPVKMPLASKETHLAALKIGDAYMERLKKPLSTDEFVELHARIVRALV